MAQDNTSSYATCNAFYTANHTIHHTIHNTFHRPGHQSVSPHSTTPDACCRPSTFSALCHTNHTHGTPATRSRPTPTRVFHCGRVP